MNKNKIAILILIATFLISVITLYLTEEVEFEEFFCNEGVDTENTEVYNKPDSSEGVLISVKTESLSKDETSSKIAENGADRPAESESAGVEKVEHDVSDERLDGVSSRHESFPVDVLSDEAVSVERKRITAYSRQDSSLIMANGQEVFEGAVASNDYPLGTRIRIDGIEYVVCDRMGVGGTVDIFMESPEAVRQWG